MHISSVHPMEVFGTMAERIAPRIVITETTPKRNECLLCFIVKVRSLLSFLSRFPAAMLTLATLKHSDR